MLQQISQLAISEYQLVHYETFRQSVGQKRYLYLSATPQEAHAGSVDINDPILRQMLQDPPHQRYAGWNMKTVGAIRIRQHALYNDDREWRHVELHDNGHLEFMVRIDESFCWRQSREEYATRPVLYPIAVCEYPVSFLRLLTAVAQHTGIKDVYDVLMAYYNVRGTFLKPGQPDSPAYVIPLFWAKEVLAENELAATTQFNPDVDHPDQVALRLITEVYNAFGYTRDQISYFDEAGNFLLNT